VVHGFHTTEPLIAYSLQGWLAERARAGQQKQSPKLLHPYSS
jgi:hypothetical protein